MAAGNEKKIMKIIGTTKNNTSCIWSTIGKGIQGINKYLDIPVLIYDHEDFVNRKIDPDSDFVIFIFEAGFAQKQHTGWDVAELKKIWPNSIFIVLSSDQILWMKLHNRNQLDYNYVDVLLEVEDEAIDHCKQQYPHLITDKWLWTISDWTIDLCEQKKQQTQLKKHFDFILVAIWGGEYRTSLVEYIASKDMTITNGGGQGHHDNDLDRLFNFYMASKVTLGTTSHNNPRIRGMKGFRDWIGPFLDCPLIYDSYPQVVESYGKNVLYYDYEDFSTIIDTYHIALDNKEYLLDKQKTWARDNTIDKQLVRLLLDRNFVNESSIISPC